MKTNQHQGNSASNASEALRSGSLLSEISRKYLKLSSDEAYEELMSGLGLVVEALDFDRGIILEFTDNHSSYIVTTVYTKPGVQSSPVKEVELEGLPYINKIRQAETLMFSSLPDDFPENWVNERAYSHAAGLKANIGLPLEVGGKVLGGLILEDCHSKRVWEEPIIWQIGILASIFATVLAHKKTNIKSNEILEFEMLLSSISASFLDLPPWKVDKEIETALKKIVYFFKADRSAIIQYIEEDNLYQVTHSFRREGIIDLNKSINEKDFPFLSKKIIEGQVVSFVTDELPYGALKDKQQLIMMGAKSGIWIPLVVSGSLIGMLSVVSVQTMRKWRKEIVARAMLFGQIFANALNRKRTELKLRSALSEIKQLKNQLEGDCAYLREEMEFEHDFHEIIGKSSQMKHVFFKIDMVAATDTTVLILGETGTGKELAARAIHEKSGRKDRPLVKLNCAALSPNIIESELFGHEKGAFTGADKKKLGRFEIANGATLFLDEIGELPLSLQSKLLRVIQEGEFERMGSTKTQKVDVRYIAATNRSLEEEVRKRRFRQDLLFRLNVYPITMPPLRNRKDDILLLANWFVGKFSKKMRKSIAYIPQDVISYLQNYNWPGNVRELENVIERAVITTKGNTLNIQDRFEEADTPQDLSAGDASVPINWSSLEEIERNYIIRVLEATKWRIDGPKGAAVILQLNPSTLRFRMKKLGVQRP